MAAAGGTSNTGVYIGGGVAAALLIAAVVLIPRAPGPDDAAQDTPQETAAPAPQAEPETAAADLETAAAAPAEDTAEPEAAPAAPTPPEFGAVRIESDGMAVIAGTAPPNANVEILLDNGEVAVTRADGAGEFAVVASLGTASVPRVLSLVAELAGGERLSSAQTLIVAPSAADAGASDADVLAMAETAEEIAEEPAAEGAEPADAAPADDGNAAAGDDMADASATEDTSDAAEMAEAVPAAEPGDTAAPADIADATDAAPATDMAEDTPETVAAADDASAPVETDAAGEALAAAARDERVEDTAMADAAVSAAAEDASAEDATAEGEAVGVARAESDDTLPEADAVASSDGAEATTSQDAAAVTEDMAANSVEDTATAGAATEAAGDDVVALAEPSVDAAAPAVLPDAPEASAGDVAVAGSEASPEAASGSPPLLLVDEGGVRVLQPATGSADTPLVMSNVALDTITYDEEGEVILSGRAPEGEFVRVYLDNEPIADLSVDIGGDWRGELPDVDTGVYTLRVDALDPEGDVVSRIETPFLREEPQVVAEAMAEDTARPDFQVAVRTIQPGNTLWAIARETYGEGILYVRVFEANRDRIRDPDLIYPGQIFRIPEPQAGDPVLAPQN